MAIKLVSVGQIDRAVLEMLKSDLSKAFNKQVSVGKEMPDPDYAFDVKRKQHLSTAILKAISEMDEFEDAEKILGLVDHDLFVPELNFVFGEAGRKAGVISLTRLRQEFYGLPPNKELFRKRVLTEAVHELGHTYGLGHCDNSYCVMFFSNSLLDTDRKGFKFCSACQKRLR